MPSRRFDGPAEGEVKTRRSKINIKKQNAKIKIEEVPYF